VEANKRCSVEEVRRRVQEKAQEWRSGEEITRRSGVEVIRGGKERWSGVEVVRGVQERRSGEEVRRGGQEKRSGERQGLEINFRRGGR
jgi:hypothetical protein